MRRALLLVTLLVGGLAPDAGAREEVVLRLPDGRDVVGVRLTQRKDHVVLDTGFGPLRVPRELLKPPDPGTESVEAPPPSSVPPDERRETRSEWFVIESDLSDRRLQTYTDYLDAFVEYMLGMYGMDRKRVLGKAPFRMVAFRSREDFKRVQDEIAPGIEAAKGQGFAEGVAGFYAPGRGTTYLWDHEGSRRESHPTTALHETTHLLNHLFSDASGVRFPVWFEEGTATYFQMFVPGVEEPEVNLAALTIVVGAIEAEKAMTSQALRSVPYAKFYSYEYAWGWALVHYLRRAKKGGFWAPLLDHLRTVSAGPPTDSENRRFLKALQFRTDEVLDRAWHEQLLAAKPAGAGTRLGSSPESLEAVAGIEAPTPEQAALFARIARSFADAGMPKATLVYAEAALRGGADDPDLHLLLATALAHRAGLAEDETWPAASLAHLRRAVERNPLSAATRHVLGEQLLLRALDPDEAAEARDMLGLALLLLGPEDDDKSIALAALEATVEADPHLDAKGARAWLEARAPRARSALARAWTYFLQARQAWEDLIEALEARGEAGTSSFEERTTLAGLYQAANRYDDAAALYAALLEEDGDALHLWPHYVRSLAQAGRTEEAAAAKEKARAALAASPKDLQHLRRLLERIPIR